jgi:hypothetical protein
MITQLAPKVAAAMLNQILRGKTGEKACRNISALQALCFALH